MEEEEVASQEQEAKQEQEEPESGGESRAAPIPDPKQWVPKERLDETLERLRGMEKIINTQLELQRRERQSPVQSELDKLDPDNRKWADWSKSFVRPQIREELAAALQARDQLILEQANELDKIKAQRLPGYEEHAEEIERIFLAQLNAGRPIPRTDIYYYVLGQRGDQSLAKKMTEETLKRERAARAARTTVEKPIEEKKTSNKPLDKMSLEEIEAALGDRQF